MYESLIKKVSFKIQSEVWTDNLWPNWVGDILCTTVPHKCRKLSNYVLNLLSYGLGVAPCPILNSEAQTPEVEITKKKNP